MNGTDENVTHQDDEIIVSTPMWLKALVAVLSIAIVCMLGLILYKIISGVGDTADVPKQSTQTPLQPAAASPAIITAAAINIARPENMTLVTFTPAGAEVYLHFRGSDGADQIVILNRSTGEVSTLKITKPEG